MRDNTIAWIAGSMYFGGILLLDWAGAGWIGITLFVVMFSLLLFVLVPRLPHEDESCEEHPENTSAWGGWPNPC
jgi:hypothetical protein